MARITIEQLKKDNGGYAYGANMLNERDLEIVNNLIDLIENTRSDIPQALDKIIYTDKYGGYYPNALLEENTYHDGLPCIVQNASAHVGIGRDGKLYFSTSGGAYDGSKDMSRFEYIGKSDRTFWAWSSAGAGAHHGIYFQAEVSTFRYNEREEQLKHLTGEFLRSIYVCEHADRPDEYGYCYTAYDIGKAWRTKESMDEFLSDHQATEEKTHNPYNRKYWIKGVGM